jgi:hypothetical protein
MTVSWTPSRYGRPVCQLFGFLDRDVVVVDPLDEPEGSGVDGCQPQHWHRLEQPAATYFSMQ